MLLNLGYVRHLTSDELMGEVANEACPVLSDAAAATVAAWYQSPRGHGAVLAALASGCTVDSEDVLNAVHREKREQPHSDTTAQCQLDCLAEWVDSKTGGRQVAGQTNLTEE